MPMTIALACLAMIAFAANTLLARAALAPHAIDAASYTAIRLVSGAVVLGLILVVQNGWRSLRHLPGNWISGAALFIYAIAFSLAYLRLGAAVGTLILFAAVQCTMLAWGMIRRDRPLPLELVGFVMAFGALIYLLSPGLNRPDLVGSGLMALSGMAWGVYSLRGRGARNPLDETAGNFIRCVPLCLPLALLPDAGSVTTPFGLSMAMTSGIAASGLGYAIWYRTLPHLSTAQAAVMQLTVPVIAGLGAVLLLGETVSLRFLIASAFILGGVALAISARRPSGPTPVAVNSSKKNENSSRPARGI